MTKQSKKSRLTIALIITGVSILILGAVLFFTVPQDIKDTFGGHHYGRMTMERFEGNEYFRGSSYRKHGVAGFVFFLIAVPVFILIIGRFSRRGSFRNGKHCSPVHGFTESPMDILRRTYADGRMTKEEYLERKKTLEEGTEVQK